MSTRSRAGAWLFVLLVTGLLVFDAVGADALDGRLPSPDRSDPRLLAEGTIDGARWVVVLVHERDSGGCLHLRQDGATVARRCAESGLPAGYEVDVELLHGASRPILFGVLPAGTARAEVAADGGATAPRFRKAAMVPLPVRTFGESGRYVVEPAPAGLPDSDRAWRDRGSASIDLHDAQGRRLTPPSLPR